MKRGLIYAATFALLVVSRTSVRSEPAAFTSITARHVGAGSVSAGRAHTVMARPDGLVYAWGAGGRGQLGTGSLDDRLSPTAVADLVGMVSVSAGAAHTVALSALGDVYAWGANAFGRIGDGTRIRRDRPVKLTGLAPVKMIAAGNAHTLALTTDGRVFAWGSNVNGQLGLGRRAAVLRPERIPGLSDVVAIAAGDAHSLAATSDGRLYSWGRNSLSALGDGTTKNRDTPVLVGLRDVVSVAAGGGHSLALSRSGVVYSWGRGASGELGAGTTKSASTPKPVPSLRATAIAAGLHFSGAISADGQILTWGENGSGQLGDGTTKRRLRPVAVRGITAASSFALGARHGVAVTLDGDVRTWGEGQRGRLGAGTEDDLNAPVEILSDVPDWGDEPTDEHEPADTTPPSIRAIVDPPLSEGWMTTPVTVSFQCEDDVRAASCSSPVTVTQDGITEVTGTAVDAAGNISVARVEIRVDLLPPRVTTAAVPDAIESAQFVLTGDIVDAGAGIDSAACNGQPLSLTGSTFTCVIRLRPGRNDIVLQARDAVGHESSSAVTLSQIGAASSLFLTPASRTITINEQSRLTLRDDFGAGVEAASWSAGDDSVIALSGDDPPQITALNTGTTLVVAEKDGMRAEAQIRVVAEMAPGEERWSLPATPLLSPEPPLFAVRVAADVPQIFAIDYEDWDRKLVRAVSSEGEVLWQQHVPGIPLFADAFGGFVAGLPDDIGDLRALMRTGGGITGAWRYNSPGILDRPAQAHDGTVYTVESVLNGQMVDGHEMKDKFAIAIDGATGKLISRTRLAPDVDQFISQYDGQVIPTVPPVLCSSYRNEYPPEVVGPIAGADGRGYFVVRHHKIVKRDLCNEPRARRPERMIEMGIDVIVLSRNSEPETLPVYAVSCTAPLGSAFPCDHPVRAVQLMPDGIGGTLVVWERGTQMVGTSVLVQKAVTRITADTRSDRDVDYNFSIEMMGQDGLAFTYGDGWKVMDVRSGDVQWSGALSNLTPLAATPEGGLAAIDWSTNELALVDDSGEIASRHAFGLDWRAAHSDSDWIGLKGESMSAVFSPFSDATRFSLFDNKTGQLSVRRPGVGIWLKTHTISPTSYQHVSIRVTPTDQRWLLENRAKFETCAQAGQCVPLGRDVFKNYFFTLGAGPGAEDTNVLCSGILTKGYNRPLDVRKEETQPLTQVPIDIQLEPLLINSLTGRFDDYANNLPYHCFPEEAPGLYNSNSFAHGLLHAASVGHSEEPPTRGAIPGWLTPVPLPMFFKKP